MPNRKSKCFYKGTRVDSREEIEFFSWLDSLPKDILIEYEYQPPSFEIFPSIKTNVFKSENKMIERVILRRHVYTADFKLKFNSQYLNQLSELFIITENSIKEEKDIGLTTIEVYVDVKGTFNRFSGDRVFSLNQKMVFSKYGIFVNKVVPKKLKMKYQSIFGYKINCS